MARHTEAHLDRSGAIFEEPAPMERTSRAALRIVAYALKFAVTTVACMLGRHARRQQHWHESPWRHAD